MVAGYSENIEFQPLVAQLPYEAMEKNTNRLIKLLQKITQLTKTNKIPYTKIGELVASRNRSIPELAKSFAQFQFQEQFLRTQDRQVELQVNSNLNVLEREINEMHDTGVSPDIIDTIKSMAPAIAKENKDKDRKTQKRPIKVPKVSREATEEEIIAEIENGPVSVEEVVETGQVSTVMNCAWCDSNLCTQFQISADSITNEEKLLCCQCWNTDSDRRPAEIEACDYCFDAVFKCTRKCGNHGCTKLNWNYEFADNSGIYCCKCAPNVFDGVEPCESCSTGQEPAPQEAEEEEGTEQEIPVPEPPVTKLFEVVKDTPYNRFFYFINMILFQVQRPNDDMIALLSKTAETNQQVKNMIEATHEIDVVTKLVKEAVYHYYDMEEEKTDPKAARILAVIDLLVKHPIMKIERDKSTALKCHITGVPIRKGQGWIMTITPPKKAPILFQLDFEWTRIFKSISILDRFNKYCRLTVKKLWQTDPETVLTKENVDKMYEQYRECISIIYHHFSMDVERQDTLKEYIGLDWIEPAKKRKKPQEDTKNKKKTKGK